MRVSSWARRLRSPRTIATRLVPRWRRVDESTDDPLVVVCSVGIDLDLVPFAADARLAVDPDAALVLALHERDVHPVTQRMVDRLVDPAEIVAVSP